MIDRLLRLEETSEDRGMIGEGALRYAESAINFSGGKAFIPSGCEQVDRILTFKAKGQGLR